MGLTLRSLRDVGKFQWLAIILFNVAVLPGNWGNTGILFMAPKLDHWCSVDFPSFQNLTKFEKRELTANWPKCQKPSDAYWISGDGNVSDTNWTKCTDIEYDTTIFEYTVTQKYSLACGREWLISVGNSVYMCGYFLSAVTAGALSDRFGRKRILITFSICAVVSNLVTALAPVIEVYFAGRFCAAFAEMSYYVANYILVLELVRKDQRVVILGVSGPFGFILSCALSGVATLLPHHEHLLYVMTGFGIVFLVVNWVVLPESPRWVRSRKRHQEAGTIVDRIASFNHQDKHDLDYLSHGEAETKTNVTPLYLFRTPIIRKRTLIFFVLWLSTVFINYGLLFNLGEFGEDIRISMILYAVFEFAALVVVVYIMEKFGRQSSLFAMMILSGMCCLLMAPIVGDKASYSLLTLALLGKSFAGNQFCLVYQFTPEIYPTSIRSVGLGASSTVARIGGMIAPLISLLNQYWSPMLVVLLGSINLLAAGLVPLVPDTTGHELPQTIEDGENFFKDHRYKLVLPPDFSCCKSCTREPAQQNDTEMEKVGSV